MYAQNLIFIYEKNVYSYIDLNVIFVQMKFCLDISLPTLCPSPKIGSDSFKVF